MQGYACTIQDSRSEPWARVRVMTLTMLLAVLAVLQLVSPAVAAPHGGGGGVAFTHDCGAGEVLIGVNIRTGTVVQSVEALCVKVNRNGTWADSPVMRGHAGGNGGTVSRQLCRNGWAVTGIHGRAGSLVDSLGIRCSPLRAVLDPEVTAAVGGPGGADFDYRCPNATVRAATGLRGRSTTVLNQIDLRCPSYVPVNAVDERYGPSLTLECPAGYAMEPRFDGRYIVCVAVVGQCLDRGTFNADPRGAYDPDLFRCERQGGYPEQVNATCPRPPPGARYTYEIDRSGTTDKCSINLPRGFTKFDDTVCPSEYSKRRVSGRDMCERWKATWDPAKVTDKIAGQSVDFLSCPDTGKGPYFAKLSGTNNSTLTCAKYVAKCGGLSGSGQQTFGTLNGNTFTCAWQDGRPEPVTDDVYYVSPQ